MGKIYTGQTNIQIWLYIRQDAAGTAKIQYRKPDGTEGEWDGVIIGSGTDTYVRYIPPAGTDLFDQAGNWLLWVKITYPTAKRAYSEPVKVIIYEVGSRNV